MSKRGQHSEMLDTKLAVVWFVLNGSGVIVGGLAVATSMNGSSAAVNNDEINHGGDSTVEIRGLSI